MLFHSFGSQEERKEYGGTAFLELQYCRLPIETPRRKIESVRNPAFFKDDSLYVHESDLNLFLSEYADLFAGGDAPDTVFFGLLFGVNYYPPEQIDALTERIAAKKPTDGEVLIAWLKGAKETNGFYVLGM